MKVTTADGCKDSLTKSVTVLPILAAPVVTTSNITPTSIQFNWGAVTGAVSYEVSVNGGTFTTPSSGTTGLVHIIPNLQPQTQVCIVVRVNGTIACQAATSTSVCGTTILPDVDIYVPNTFTPNADGKNDLLKVYGNYIKAMNFQVFNQWGEKIFETQDVNGGWDGTSKGKLQPVGVYIYTLTVEIQNGTTVNKKGSVNLIR